MVKNKRIVPDEDSPELTEADFARGRPMREVMPEIVKLMKRGRGRPKLAAPKKRVSLRIDADVVAAYRATGDGWQSRANDALAHAIGIRRASRSAKTAKA